MKSLITAAALATAVMLSAPAADACDGSPMTTQIGKIDVESLAALMPSKVIFDANGEKTRKTYGVIPKARMLTNHASYDVAKTLPKNKDESLVFYCAAEACSASTVAAQRAVDAGYKDVAILPVGIIGWTKAGHKLDSKK